MSAAALVAFCVLLNTGGLKAEVIVNEIMFHPPPAVPEDPAREWIAGGVLASALLLLLVRGGLSVADWRDLHMSPVHGACRGAVIGPRLNGG
jgi:hypothetical protein